MLTMLNRIDTQAAMYNYSMFGYYAITHKEIANIYDYFGAAFLMFCEHEKRAIVFVPSVYDNCYVFLQRVHHKCT